MKLSSAMLVLIAGVALAPLAGYAADDKTSDKAASVKERVKENAEDAKITSKVKAAFAKDKAVSAIKIHVETEKGVVKLTGNAKSPEEVDKAVSIAKSTEGVTSVQNEIHVGAKSTTKKAGVKQTGKDAMITTKVKAKFAKDTDVSAMKIRVKTKDGVVHLRGKARSTEEANKAVELAQNTEGVTSVKNEIHVTGTGATR